MATSEHFKEVAARIQQHAAIAASLQQRFEGYSKLFNAAALSGNDAEMEQWRSAAHATLDQLMDNAAMQLRFQTELLNIPPDYTI